MTITEKKTQTLPSHSVSLSRYNPGLTSPVMRHFDIMYLLDMITEKDTALMWYSPKNVEPQSNHKKTLDKPRLSDQFYSKVSRS